MKMNRRQFLASSAFAAPIILTPGCATRFLANSRLNVAVIGCGRIASSFEIPGVLERSDIARIVAVCDLDDLRVKFTKKRIEAHYAKKGICQTVRAYHDYKEVCACADVDAVMLCLPDFWHALVASTAICAGKAVWLQKPFTQTITEGRILANLAKKYNTVLQVGSQQRSWNVFQAACRDVLAGKIGAVKRVEVGIGLDKAGGCAKAEKVPSTFDYETWLGPTDHSVPYNWTRCHNQNLSHICDRPGWIQLAPYGWGIITNWGAHHLDVVRWGLGALGPEGVTGTCEWMDMSGDKLWNVHTGYDLHYRFNNGFTDVHLNNRYQLGIKFIGESGDWLWCTRGNAKVTPSDPEPRVKPGMLGPIAASRPCLLPRLSPQPVSATQAHVDNWLEAVVANNPTMTATNAEGGHRSTSLCSLGQMCMELGRGRKDGFHLAWDAKKEATGNPKADALMKPFANGKYDLKVNLAEFGLDYNTIMKG